MYVRDWLGREIALVLNPEWRKMRSNLCRFDPGGFDDSAGWISFEKLVAVDDTGVWVERSGDEHLLSEFRSAGEDEFRKVDISLSIMIPWDQILQIGVVTRGTFQPLEDRKAGKHSPKPDPARPGESHVAIRGVTTGYGMDD